MINLLDPGHDDIDPGAITGKIKESVLAFQIINRVKVLVENYQRTVLTRQWLQGGAVPLNDRIAQAKEIKADRFISIHCNSFSDPDAKGLEIFYKRGCSKSQDIASSLIESIRDYAKQSGYTYVVRGIKTDDLYINYSPCPAVLIECGFMSNPTELQWLTSPLGQISIGFAIAKVLLVR